MIDAHAHIGDNRYKDAIVCSASPLSVPDGYRFNSIGLIPQSMCSDISIFEEYASNGYFIGEIGLDRRYPDIDKQLKIFESILSIARNYDSFVTVHMVGFQEATFDALRKSGIRRFLLHGYTGSVEMARRFISIGGIISLSARAEKAKSFHSLLSLPFVTETDMPMGEDERDTLTSWNRKLSMLTGRDIENESEKLLMEMIYG